MGRKVYEQVCLRFSLEDERDKRLYKILTELNLGIHKSKNKFIKNAIDAYVNGTNSENTYVSPKNDKALTERDLNLRLEQMKNEIRMELYQEMLVMFMKAGLSSASTLHSNTSSQDSEQIVSDSQKDMGENAPTDEMMENIMKWS